MTQGQAQAGQQTHQGGDIWQQAAERELSRRNERLVQAASEREAQEQWAEQMFERLLFDLGHVVDAERVSIRRQGHHSVVPGAMVLEYQGAEWLVDIPAAYGGVRLWAWRPGWEMWRQVRDLADLAG